MSIDYGLANLMLPLVLLGSLNGVVVNLMFPSLILQVILSVLLIFLTIQAGIKAKNIYRLENQELKLR